MLQTVDLRITATGLVRHEVIPDFVTTYFVELTDPDAHTFEGFFDDPRTTQTPPGITLVGEVPTRVGPGHYGIKFSMERVNDESSFVPVPDGTPFETNRERITSCDTTFDARPGADLAIAAHFAIDMPDDGGPEGTCTIEITSAANAS